MSDFENETFDWDGEIEQDGQEFIILDEGDYPFTVTKVERKNFEGSDKMPRCNQVVVYGQVDTPKGAATFRENLFLLKKQEWKLSGFFRCLGMKKHGEKLKMDFPGAVGRKGMAHFTPYKKGGNIYNSIDRYYDYDPAKMNGGFTEVKDDDVPW